MPAVVPLLVDAHDTTLGGIIADSGKFDWKAAGM